MTAPRKPKPPEWPAAHLAALRRHHADGLSASESVRALNAEFPGAGYTRNAVNTKRSRLGLKVHPVAASINNKRLRPPTDGPVAQSVAPVKPRLYEIPTTAKVLAHLRSRECKWPVGADPGIGNCDRLLFCAAVVPPEDWETGIVFCPDHAEAAYQKQRSPEEKARAEARAARMRAGKGKAPGINGRLFAGGKGRAA